MRDRVIIGLAIGVGVPLAEDVVLGLDGLADEPAAGLVLFQVVLVAFDAGRELGRDIAANSREPARYRVRRASAR